jgi:DNA-directed RNA polymerase subunit RPC12/RpoP
MAFDTYDCRTCGDEFKAYEDAEAARTEYCSPTCHTDGGD